MQESTFPEDACPSGEPENWDPAVHRRLEAFTAACAADPQRHRAWAVFDWDFTLLDGDIGDALFSYMLHHRLVQKPQDWRATSDHLTPAALRRLENLLRRERGGCIPETPELRQEMETIYFRQQTTAGETAFAGFDETACHPSYAWCARLLAGLSVEEASRLTLDVLRELLSAPPGTMRYGHPGEWKARPVRPMMKLFRQLASAGLSVAVVSASPQPAVEACLSFFELPAACPLGVRTHVDVAGRLTPKLAPCGRRAGVIPYGRGKRAWISHVIGQRMEPAWYVPDADLCQNIWFAAGDSAGDWAMLEDASRLRLVVARRESRVTDAARKNADGRWLLAETRGAG